MTDHDYGEDRDPLLVRPYLLHDSGGSGAAEPSTQTWPSATTREVRSQRALEGADDPTAILYLPQASPRHRRETGRRVLVVAAAGAAVLLGAGVAGMIALRPDEDRPPAATALQDPPPLATTGPPPGTPSPAATGSASLSASASAASRTAAAGTASASAGASSSAPAGATATSPDGNGRTTEAPPAALAPEPPSTARTGAIRGQNGLCLDLNGGVAVEDNHVQVFTCNSSVAQQWTLATDGTMRVSGMCAQITGDNTVHITKCDGRATAQWQISGQRLISVANSRCLTDPSSGATPGTAVSVTTCGGAANQRWSLP